MRKLKKKKLTRKERTTLPARLDGLTHAQAIAFGMENESQTYAESVEQALVRNPGLIIAEAVNPTFINIGKDQVKKFPKGVELIMPISIFIDGHKDKNNGTILLKPSKTKFTDIFNRYRGQNLDNKKILFSRMGGLGDCMMMQPIARYLKAKYPTCKISFATNPAFMTLFDNWPENLIDRVYTIPYTKQELLEHDYVFIITNCIENNLEARKTSYHEIIKKAANLKFHYREYPQLLIPKEDLREKYKKILPNGPLIGIHMFSSSLVRSLEPKRWARIISLLNEKGYNIILFGSPIEYEKAEKFINLFSFDRSKVFNSTRLSASLSDAIAMLSLTDGLVAIDSFFVHAAQSLDNSKGIPTVGFFGAFPSTVVGDHYSRLLGVHPPVNWNICGNCPCFQHIDQKKCPYIANDLYPGCLTYINEDDIVDKFLTILSSKKID